MNTKQQREHDRAVIEGLQFKRWTRLHDIFDFIYCVLARQLHVKHHQRLQLLIAWFKVPLTLWAVPVEGMARHVARRIASDRPLDPEMEFLLELMDNLPDDATIREISEFEQFVYEGKYEICLKERTKYAAKLRELTRNPLFRRQLARMQKLFPFKEFWNHKGIIRRTLVPERNLRSDWTFPWFNRRKRFQIVFDAFCHYWNLYGFEYNEPLLLKPSVNPTPHGIMIFIPAYWNLNPWTDLNWPLIRRLIKCRARAHQGSKRAAADVERIEECLRTLEVDNRAIELGYESEKRRVYTVTEAGLAPQTSSRQIRRNRETAEKFLRKQGK